MEGTIMGNETLRKARGISVIPRESGIMVVNGRLEPVVITPAELEIFNLLDGKKDIKTICDTAQKKGITQEKTRHILELFCEKGIAVPKKDEFYPEDEQLFTQTWKGINMDYMSVDILPRIHVIQEDPYLGRITFVPSKKKGDIIPVLKEVLKRASRTPIIEFMEADTYLDGDNLLELVRTTVDELEHDMPYFFFEFKKNILSENDIENLLDMVKAPQTQILGPWTRIARVFGEEALYLTENAKIDSYDDNICIALDVEGITEDVEMFRKFPGIYLGFVADSTDITRLSEGPFPLFLKHSKGDKKFLDTVLKSEAIFFMEDDVYRVQRAIQKYYLLFTDCGAGKRKVAVTLDGDVYPCADAAYKDMFRLGNVKEESINNILGGEAAQKVREKIKKNFEHCAETCCLAFFCGGCLISERCSIKKEMVSSYLEGM
jgi:radical SAM protein with 4Fe4S-binding SPASM domain